MEWICGPCYMLVHPNRRARGLTSRHDMKCSACGDEKICEMTVGETVELAIQLKTEMSDPKPKSKTH